MTCKNRPRYDLQCVWWGVKPCSINPTVSRNICLKAVEVDGWINSGRDHFFAEEWRRVIRHGHGAGVMLWLLPALRS